MTGCTRADGQAEQKLWPGIHGNLSWLKGQMEAVSLMSGQFQGDGTGPYVLADLEEGLVSDGAGLLRFHLSHDLPHLHGANVQ